jgi:hypothetical protein
MATNLLGLLGGEVPQRNGVTGGVPGGSGDESDAIGPRAALAAALVTAVGGAASRLGRRLYRAAWEATRRLAGAARREIRRLLNAAWGTRRGSTVGAEALRVYEHNPKHAFGRAVGTASRAPRDGEVALISSIPIDDRDMARVAIDYEEGVFVMFRQHRSGPGGRQLFHGYVVESFDQLPREAQRALRQADLVRGAKGKIRELPFERADGTVVDRLD